MLNRKLKVTTAQGEDENAVSAFPEDGTPAADETLPEPGQVGGQQLVVISPRD